METEMKPQVKKEWKTPELIVLVRSKPEEAVLTACKTFFSGGNGLNAAQFACYITGPCQNCSTTVGS